MPKPNIRIITNSPIIFHCGTPRTVDVEVRVYNIGPGQVCISIPDVIQCKFVESGSKRICTPITVTHVSQVIQLTFTATMNCTVSNTHFSRLYAKVVDANGETRYTYRRMKVHC